MGRCRSAKGARLACQWSLWASIYTNFQLQATDPLNRSKEGKFRSLGYSSEMDISSIQQDPFDCEMFHAKENSKAVSAGFVPVGINGITETRDDHTMLALSG